ncbi:MAG TPA: GAF domain-containing sensor histidine kinase [Nitriliruptoraceae bacterium]|nr:GAF domain-containing sensor histidine kinase [Nitriliruptoraceae bacterium]
MPPPEDTAPTSTDVQERIDAVVGVAAALAGELSLDDLLDHVVEAARQATGARYAALGVIGDDQQLARFVHAGIDDDTVAAIGALPTGRGVLGLLIRNPETLRLDHLAAHPASVGFPAHHPPMDTFLGTPIRSGGKVFGNLYLSEKAGGFTDQDQRLVEVLAVQVGAAVDNALMAQRLQDLAVQAERERISRDLHDGIIQTLFSIGMSLDAARTMVDTDPARAQKRLDDAVNAIDTTIRDLRNTIFQLRADDAAALGLRAGLVELAREHEVNALSRPRLTLPDHLDVVVPGTLVPDILQMVRESLANAAKHSRASLVEVRIEIRGSSLLVEVSDDGVGFDPTQPSAGHGLSNIRERATLHDGSTTITSNAGTGTRVRALLPLPT